MFVGSGMRIFARQVSKMHPEWLWGYSDLALGSEGSNIVHYLNPYTLLCTSC